MIELNLLPDVKKEFIKAQKTRNRVISFSLIAVVAVVGATIALALFVYGGQNLRIAQLTGDIKTKQSELNEVKDLSKYLTIQNQLTHIDSLHQGKFIFSRLVGFISALNPKEPNNIQLSRLSVDSENKSITFEGSAATFEAFNVYKDTLLNATVSYSVDGVTTDTPGKLFQSVTVESSSLSREQDKQVVSFRVLVVYDENTFLSKSENVIVKVPQLETTSSVQQSPQPLFNNDTPEETQ